MTTAPTTQRPSRRGPTILLATLVVAATALAGCGGSGEASAPDRPDRPDRPAATVATTDTGTPTPSAAPEAPTAELGTLSVRADRDLAVHVTPGDAEPVRFLPARNGFGSPLALLVTEVGDGPSEGWLEVLLPGRPNGATGWVRADDVTAHAVAHEVRVDLAARTLTVVAGEQVVLTTPVAIGDADHPTPTGRFSLTDKLETGDPDGPYGPYALGLSGRSDVLTEFAGGDGQVGIHGTNDPSSIGRAASHGCLRVPNDVAATLSDLLALGTPVVIT